ncbi:MAG: glycosyltransferase family 2 protein [Acidobacteria bacterium]|nr:glycosyltransferase family 2 protein [Acidobacteriota bacterium]
MEKVTAIIPAGNEAHQIADAVRSVLWADEVFVVVDAASNDHTYEAAKAIADPKVRVTVHEFNYPAAQKNWAIPQASHPWVFLLDADERPEPELVSSIRKLLEEGPKADVYWIWRSNAYFGRVMRFGGLSNDKVARLFRRDCRYEDVKVHEEIALSGLALGAIKQGRLLHDTIRDWPHYLAKNELYSRWGAEQLFKDGKRAGLCSILLRPLHRFLKQYLFRLGFLDGVPGAIVAVTSAYCVFLKYSMLWTMSKGWPAREEQYVNRLMRRESMKK